MKLDSAIDEIQEINLSYLLLAQRLLKEDYATALFRLKIKESLAKVLVSLTAKQLAQLARTNQLLFRLHFEDPDQLIKLTSNKRAQGLGHIHTALLMSSNAS
ncbi:flagellar transcriptional regulator FlhD [Microbulbifer thermotolerans]|uniref:Flagellar transcriptional regulator FlhD n=1 Tax=Microbulbifer thermotolerans TaxID=252514 RepID=A0AB35HYN4_MICTH|nr:flagellar transcriptional regulator FlhD [Microbulbifer thermotolerans]MCX2780136.1 flagellar transcriptional regulator FlhD [Microbulbifer thermotolerans]MCX2802163.1 flagellar transcriptional regulator FlhD [Microbulbifer thermotolerans]MCX2805560.1 flagellar transcriptional regulator FlhD [Microbulbifer thermotolerans]MCX2831912.1 flagellar transcriptional regulator FlhD [Microbulbifer thermotolerans]MCX2842523.1 flagellar transcriptional regulator FlhD [Microbulbifer thermotolerans]